MSDIATSDIGEAIPRAFIILDRNLNITSANRVFYQTFHTSRGETEGCHICELGNRQWDIPALRTLLESVIPHRASTEGFEVEHDFSTIGRRTMLVNARRIFRPGDHDGSILLAIEDVSEQRASRAESKRNWQLIQKYRRHDPRSPGRPRTRHDDRNCEQGFFANIRVEKFGVRAMTSNKRIRGGAMLNQSCVAVVVVESMLLTDSLQKHISTAC